MPFYTFYSWGGGRKLTGFRPRSGLGQKGIFPAVLVFSQCGKMKGGRMVTQPVRHFGDQPALSPSIPTSVKHGIFRTSRFGCFSSGGSPHAVFALVAPGASQSSWVQGQSKGDDRGTVVSFVEEGGRSVIRTVTEANMLRWLIECRWTFMSGCEERRSTSSVWSVWRAL